MNCDKFKKNIDEYCLDPDFDWKLRYEMDDHLINCEQCQKIYALSSLVTSKEVMSEPIKSVRMEMVNEKTEVLPFKDIKEKFISLIDSLNQLTSESLFPFTTLSLATIRGGESQKGPSCIGDPILIYLESPQDVDRYLTIFHYDDNNNLEMLFPNKSSDETLIKAKEEKKIRLIAGPPAGKHYLKAVLTTNKLVEPHNIDFGSESEIVSVIRGILEPINSKKEDNWIEAFVEFEVID